MDSSIKAIHPISLDKVKVNDKFWAPRIEINRKISIPHVIEQCEKTGRIKNFLRAGGFLDDGKRPIFPFDDSDVFKTVEGAAYSLIHFPNPKLEEYLDNLIGKIEAAQEDDGYLYTTRTINPDKPHIWAGKKRWELVSVLSHELYNMGHLIEAGIAYYQVTGKKRLLNVAIKSADLIYEEFVTGKLERVPGHQEIELALIRLYKITDNKKYLKLVKFFLDIRGSTKAFDFKDYLKKFKIYFEDTRSPEYNQTHKRIIEQDEAVGHAVRAAYMYAAITDIVSIYGESEYETANNHIWDNVVSKKLYITGGIGARGEGESFGINYDLPNFEAYAETCAAIAIIFWNYRLFLLYGDAKYIDILERTLYNGFLSGVSLDGKKFFYTNPLASKGNVYRRSWWKCPCCPTNIIRFLPQIPNYIYAIKGKTIFINLFIGSTAKVFFENNEVSIYQETDYPWNEKVKITIHTPQMIEFELAIRVPGWTQNKPVPSDLYSYLKPRNFEVIIKINNEIIDFQLEKGFVKIQRAWKNNNTIELTIPMPIRRVLSNERVENNADKLAIERGPIVYCIESVNNKVASIFDLSLDDNAMLEQEYRDSVVEGIFIHSGDITFIPYYAWANQGKSEMAVWIKRSNSF